MKEAQWNPGIATHWDRILGDENGWGQEELELGFFVGLVHLKAQPVQQNTGTGQVVHITVLQAKSHYTVIAVLQAKSQYTVIAVLQAKSQYTVLSLFQL